MNAEETPILAPDESSEASVSGPAKEKPELTEKSLEGLVGKELWQARRELAAKKRTRDRGGLFVPTTTNPLVGLLMARQVSGLSPQKATPPPSVESPPPIPKTSKTSSKKSMKATPKSRKRAEPEADDDDDSEAAPTAKRPKVSKGTKGRPTQTRKDDFAEVDAPKGKKAQKSRAAAKPTARMGKRGVAKAQAAQDIASEEDKEDEVVPISKKPRSGKEKAVADVTEDEEDAEREPDPSSSKRGAKGIRAAAQEDVVNKATKVLANSRKRRKVELQQSVDPVRSDDDAESAAASSSRKPKGAQALDTAATKKRVMSKPGPDEKNSRKKGRPQVLADVESAQELSDEEEEVAKPVEGRKPKAAASGKDAKTKPATRRKATKSDDRALLDKSNSTAWTRSEPDRTKTTRKKLSSKPLRPPRNFKFRRSLVLLHNPEDSDDDPIDCFLSDNL